MKVSIDDIKQLRAQTSASLSDVKNALDKAEGNYENALRFLYEKGLSSAVKRMDKETGQGIVYSYVHNYRIGVMLELNCETDFVARNPEFIELAKDLAIQIVMNDAQYINASELSPSQSDQIDKVLLDQNYYKNSSIKVEDHIKQMIAKFGENIKLSRFYKMTLEV